jgi:putative transcriptional regulator
MSELETLTAEQIKDLRLSLDLTQEQFAGEVGVHVMTVSRWERGESAASGLALRELLRISKRAP